MTNLKQNRGTKLVSLTNLATVPARRRGDETEPESMTGANVTQRAGLTGEG